MPKHIKEHSFGVIPLQRKRKEWIVLLVCHEAGHWAFPKGHPEEGEKPHETAARELFEETGLAIEQFLPEGPYQEHYYFSWKGELIEKKVDYFPAEVSGSLSPQFEEIIEARWFTLDEAEKQATFPETKRICTLIKENLLR